MADVVGSYVLSMFTTPAANSRPISSAELRANFNALRDAHVNHDADAGLHWQAAAAAAVTGATGTGGHAKWLTTDTRRVYVDLTNGGAFSELAYLPTSGGTVSGNLAVTGTATLGAASVTGTASAALFSGSGASLTALNASSLASGTVADARLSANVGLVNATLSPTSTASYDLGASGAQWRDVYASRDVLTKAVRVKNAGAASLNSGIRADSSTLAVPGSSATATLIPAPFKGLVVLTQVGNSNGSAMFLVDTDLASGQTKLVSSTTTAWGAAAGASLGVNVYASGGAGTDILAQAVPAIGVTLSGLTLQSA